MSVTGNCLTKEQNQRQKQMDIKNLLLKIKNLVLEDMLKALCLACDQNK